MLGNRSQFGTKGGGGIRYLPARLLHIIKSLQDKTTRWTRILAELKFRLQRVSLAAVAIPPEKIGKPRTAGPICYGKVRAFNANATLTTGTSPLLPATV